MKRILSVFLSICCLVSCGLLSACNGNRNKSKLSVVCTIFPLYDWTCNILGDKKEGCDISLLAESGVDMHSYQPSAADLVSISQCDLFIYVGGESDKWVEKALQNPVNRSRKVLNLIEALGDAAKDEKTPEGADENHDHDHEDNEEHEKDEHVWLSVKNAAVICEKIAAELAVIDSENASVYAENLVKYTGDSFRDLTRIAKINDEMWSELFLLNKDALISEMENFRSTFDEFYDALKNENRVKMREMMKCSTQRR